MLPPILSGGKLSGNFWAQPHWTSITSFYQNLIAAGIPSLVAVVTVGVVASRFRTGTSDRLIQRGCRIPILRAECNHWLHRSTPRRRPLSEARYRRLYRSLCPSGRSGIEHSVRSSNAQDAQGANFALRPWWPRSFSPGLDFWRCRRSAQRGMFGRVSKVPQRCSNRLTRKVSQLLPRSYTFFSNCHIILRRISPPSPLSCRPFYGRTVSRIG